MFFHQGLCGDLVGKRNPSHTSHVSDCGTAVAEGGKGARTHCRLEERGENSGL